VKLVQVAGWLGSGKTTLIIALGRGLSDRGKKIAIVVNEIGAVPVDGRVVQECGHVQSGEREKDRPRRIERVRERLDGFSLCRVC